MRYEYRVLPIPVNDEGTLIKTALHLLLNEQGAEEFELVTMSFERGVVIFQRDVYVERASREHIEDVLKAVKSYGDVSALSFVLTADNPLSDGPFPPREVEEDEALRFLIERILKES